MLRAAWVRAETATVILQTDIFRRLVRDEMQPPPVQASTATAVGEVVKRMAETANSVIV